MVKGAPIVGISLGSTRDFVLSTKAAGRVASIPLVHGSAVVMKGGTQFECKHAVPPRKRVTLPRVSLTFRVLKAS
jgi:alkylated DNA repair dioxygenase AlkB